jgi:hypothetical protein
LVLLLLIAQALTAHKAGLDRRYTEPVACAQVREAGRAHTVQARQAARRVGALAAHTDRGPSEFAGAGSAGVFGFAACGGGGGGGAGCTAKGGSHEKKIFFPALARYFYTRW